MARRRRWAASGYLPPKLAQAFTPGEQAALAVVALEVGKRGKCSLAIGNIAAVAGVSEKTVKRALRLARTAGLVSVEERRLTRWRNDTNVVKVVSAEWAAWLRLRLPRGNHVGFPTPGGQTVHRTTTGSSRWGASRPLGGELGRQAEPLRPSDEGPRAAGA
jgi:hypothetical protein